MNLFWELESTSYHHISPLLAMVFSRICLYPHLHVLSLSAQWATQSGTVADNVCAPLPSSQPTLKFTFREKCQWLPWSLLEAFSGPGSILYPQMSQTSSTGELSALEQSQTNEGWELVRLPQRSYPTGGNSEGVFHSISQRVPSRNKFQLPTEQPLLAIVLSLSYIPMSFLQYLPKWTPWTQILISGFVFGENTCFVCCLLLLLLRPHCWFAVLSHHIPMGQSEPTFFPPKYVSIGCVLLT